MAFHLLFIFVYYVCNAILTPEEMMYLGIIHGVVGLLVSVKTDPKYINPHNITLATYILINIGNISLMHRIATGTNYMYFFASPQFIPEAALIWCLGNSAFFAGYYFAKKYTFPSIGFKLSETHLKYIFYFSVFVSLFSKFITSLNILPTAIEKVIGLSGLLGVLFFARLWAATDKSKYRNWLFVLFIIQMYNAFQSYLRFNLILPIIVLYIGYFSAKNSWKSFFSYRIIPLVLFAAVFINSFEKLGKSRLRYQKVLYEQYGNVGDDSDEEEDVEDIYGSEIDRGGVLDRMSTLAQISACCRLVHENGFYNGTVSAPLVTAAVPRFLWPDKPKIAIGQWFAIVSGGGYSADGKTVNNSVNITVPGELYMDFDLVGVLLGCFLFGAFIRSLWNACQFQESNMNFMGATLGGYMLFLAFTGVSVDLQIIINYISFYLVFLLIKRIVCAYFV